MAQIAKFEGFQRCRPFQRNTYFEVMAIAWLTRRASIRRTDENPELMPVMYALARCGIFAKHHPAKPSSNTIAVNDRDQRAGEASSSPNDTWPHQQDGCDEQRWK